MRPARVGIVLVVAGLTLALWLSHGAFEVEVPAEFSPPRTPFRGASGSRVSAPPTTDSPDDDGPEDPPAQPAVVQAPFRAEPQRSVKEALADVDSKFVRDPSLRVRCPAPRIEVDDTKCVPVRFQTKSMHPPLIGPRTPGDTTSGMQLHLMHDLLPKPYPAYIHHGTNGSVEHHPIFNLFGERTYSDQYFRDRITEFNGVHSRFDYDCEPDIDFRNYHQVRAAMCEAQEAATASGQAQVDGYFPLVDEEYLEYVMTLTTAYEAATKGRPYTFIELGARYGTWIARAGASYRQFGGSIENLNLLAVEGNCPWFRKMEEHVECNHLTAATRLVLAYAAPRSYDKVQIGVESTYNQPKAISLLDILAAYDYVDMIDFDIQGFEWYTLEEPGALDLVTAKVGFLHFGTHGLTIERDLLNVLQPRGWVVVYYFAGAHSKKLTRSHRCETPFGPSGFNDGVLGLVNRKFYKNVVPPATPVVAQGKRKGSSKGGSSCYFTPQASTLLFRE
jgi:hypothetical protein